jgi:YggT family protein
MQNSVIFLVRTLADLYLLTYLLRFILQWVRADFYNPLSQFVLRVTNPLVLPARRMLPAVRGVDLPTLVVLLLLECLVTWGLLRLVGVSPGADTFILWVLLRLVGLALWFYSVAILIYVVLSWIGPGGYNPMSAILADLTEPVLRPARRILSPIAGLDLSPLLVLILIQALLMALPLPQYLR